MPPGEVACAECSGLGVYRKWPRVQLAERSSTVSCWIRRHDGLLPALFFYNTLGDYVKCAKLEVSIDGGWLILVVVAFLSKTLLKWVYLSRVGYRSPTLHLHADRLAWSAARTAADLQQWPTDFAHAWIRLRLVCDKNIRFEERCLLFPKWGLFIKTSWPVALRCHIDWICRLQLWWPFQRSWHIKKARETRLTACRSLSQNARPAAGMSTRQIPPQLTHGATLPYRLNVLHVIVVTFSTIVAYPKSQKNMHNGL